MRSANLPVGRAVAKRGRGSTRREEISLNEIRTELGKVLSSSLFSTAHRMRRFLRLVVEETLEGRGDNLNELLLGISVYDRDKNFDPRVDSIVRVDAGRLRAKLREFYASEGASSSIGIEIPKGSYKAVFKRLHHHKELVTAERLQAKYPIGTKSLAVLPFANTSPQRDHDLLGDGLVEELIHGLSCIPNFRVASLTSVLALKSKQIDVREMGRQLGVEAFVEGSVRKAKKGIRVIVRLTDAATGFHTWSEAHAFGSRDAYIVQEGILKSILGALRVRLGAKASVRRNRKVPQT